GERLGSKPGTRPPASDSRAQGGCALGPVSNPLPPQDLRRRREEEGCVLRPCALALLAAPQPEEGSAPRGVSGPHCAGCTGGAGGVAKAGGAGRGRAAGRVAPGAIMAVADRPPAEDRTWHGR